MCIFFLFSLPGHSSRQLWVACHTYNNKWIIGCWELKSHEFNKAFLRVYCLCIISFNFSRIKFTSLTIYKAVPFGEEESQTHLFIRTAVQGFFFWHQWLMCFWRGKFPAQKRGNFGASCYCQMLEMVPLWPYKLFWKCTVEHLHENSYCGMFQNHGYYWFLYDKLYYNLARRKKKLS